MVMLVVVMVVVVVVAAMLGLKVGANCGNGCDGSVLNVDDWHDQHDHLNQLHEQDEFHLQGHQGEGQATQAIVHQYQDGELTKS